MAIFDWEWGPREWQKFPCYVKGYIILLAFSTCKDLFLQKELKNLIQIQIQEKFQMQVSLSCRIHLDKQNY